MNERLNPITFVPRRLREDVTEAIERARLKDMGNIAQDVICGCKGCMTKAREGQAFWGYSKLPDRKGAKEVIQMIKDYEGKA